MYSSFRSHAVDVVCMESHPGEHSFISFKKCCISNAFDGSEDDIVWKDDLEDKDDSDWVESTDNDSVMSDDGESDE
jgi:hypothetical protein